MNTWVLLTCALCCVLGRTGAAGNRVNSGGVVYAAAPSERGAYAVGGAGGPYNYGYNTGDGIAKVEVRQPSGAVVGSYRYFDPTGKQVVRSYIADEKGFRVLGNDLPISPDTPASQVLGTPAFTGAVEGTSEFDIPPPLNSNAQPQSFSVTQQQSQSHLQQQQALKQQQQNDLLQEQQSQYQQQQNQLEEQRRQLKLQQEKLEALQRDLEQQQRLFQEQYEKQTQTQQASVQTQAQQQFQYQTQPQPQPSQQQFQYQTQNTLTGGYTSPYYYYPQQYNFDFPAGFAYAGLPVVKPPIGVKFQHPENPAFSAGHTASNVKIAPPVAPHRQYNDNHNPITAGHTHGRRGHGQNYVIGLAR